MHRRTELPHTSVECQRWQSESEALLGLLQSTTVKLYTSDSASVCNALAKQVTFTLIQSCLLNSSHVFQKPWFLPIYRMAKFLVPAPLLWLDGMTQVLLRQLEESLLSLLMLISWSYQDSVLLRPRMQTVRAGAAPWRKVPTREMDKRHTITSTERC